MIPIVEKGIFIEFLSSDFSPWIVIFFLYIAVDDGRVVVVEYQGLTRVTKKEK